MIGDILTIHPDGGSHNCTKYELPIVVSHKTTKVNDGVTRGKFRESSGQ